MSKKSDKKFVKSVCEVVSSDIPYLLIYFHKERTKCFASNVSDFEIVGMCSSIEHRVLEDNRVKKKSKK